MTGQEANSNQHITLKLVTVVQQLLAQDLTPEAWERLNEIFIMIEQSKLTVAVSALGLSLFDRVMQMEPELLLEIPGMDNPYPSGTLHRLVRLRTFMRQLESDDAQQRRQAITHGVLLTVFFRAGRQSSGLMEAVWASELGQATIISLLTKIWAVAGEISESTEANQMDVIFALSDRVSVYVDFEMHAYTAMKSLELDEQQKIADSILRAVELLSTRKGIRDEMAITTQLSFMMELLVRLVTLDVQVLPGLIQSFEIASTPCRGRLLIEGFVRSRFADCNMYSTEYTPMVRHTIKTYYIQRSLPAVLQMTASNVLEQLLAKGKMKVHHLDALWQLTQEASFWSGLVSKFDRSLAEHLIALVINEARFGAITSGQLQLIPMAINTGLPSNCILQHLESLCDVYTKTEESHEAQVETLFACIKDITRILGPQHIDVIASWLCKDGSE